MTYETIADGDDVSSYLARVLEHPILTREQERGLFKRFKRGGGEGALREIVFHNQRLVFSVAKGFLSPQDAFFVELMYAGNVALISAAKAFELSRNVKFSTFAVKSIRREMDRYFNRNRMVPLSSNALNDYRKVLGYLRQCDEEGVEPDHAVMSEIIIRESSQKGRRDKSTLVGIVEYHRRTFLSISNSRERDMDGGVKVDVSLPLAVCDESVLENEEGASFLRRALFKSIEKLTGVSKRDGEIFMIRYGLDGFEPLTLEEIGGLYGLTRERVRQIESEILGQLRGDTSLRKLYELYGEKEI